METEWEPARPPQAQRAWQRVLRPIAADLAAHAAVLGDEATAALQAAFPHWFPDAESVMLSRKSTADSIRLLAASIEQGADPRTSPLPAATLEATRAGVERQVSLDGVLRSYRIGHEMVWRWLFDHIIASCADAAEQATAISLASSWLFAYIDSAVAEAVSRYEVEHDAWLRGAAAARAEAIDAILARRDQQRAATRLRYELNRNHLGVIIWGRGAAPDTPVHAVVDEAVAALAQRFGAEGTLTHLLGPQTQAVWFSRITPFTEADIESSRSVLPASVRVALGEPAHGLDGFRRTHIEAGHTRRVAMLTEPHTSALTRYRDVAVTALATLDAEQARTFVNRVLGPLAANDETSFRVAMTLAAYLDQNRSPARTAELLTIHPNTVTYRVNQAREILARSTEDDTLDLRVALALLPALRGL